MKINPSKFEDALLKEHKRLTRVFNECYADRIVYDNEALHSKTLLAKLEVLGTVIKALRDSVEYE